MTRPLPSRAPRAAILDFNGVIADDEPLLAELFMRLARSLGGTLERDRYFAHLAGLDDLTIVRRLLAEVGRPTDDVAAREQLARKIAWYKEAVAARLPVVAETIGFMRALAARVPLAVASGAPREEIEFVLERAGMRELFPVLVSLEDVRRGKPDPEGFLLALAELQRLRPRPEPPLRAADVLVIEDSGPGVRAAKAGGFRCLGVGDRDALSQADRVVRRLEPALVDDLFAVG